MGTWGTGISSNDVYETINYQFFELYNEGLKVPEITEKLISAHQELIDSFEDQHNFWLAIAKSQWECKALDPIIYQRIKEIITSKRDLELWKNLDASRSDLKKREKALNAFLATISVEKKNAQKIKSKVFKDAIFEKGTCLTYKLSDGDYCGAFVLASEKNTEFGLNLIVVTDIKKNKKPTEKDFRKANILFQFEQQIDTTYIPEMCIAWYFSQYYKKAATKFEKVGQLNVKKAYNSQKDYQRFSDWDNLKLFQDTFYKDYEKNKCDIRIKLRRLRKKFLLHSLPNSYSI